MGAEEATPGTLQRSAADGDVEAVQRFLDDGAEEADVKLAWVAAFQHGRTDVVRVLMRAQNADFDPAKSSAGFGTLHDFIRMGQTPALKTLLELGHDPNTPSAMSPYLPLGYACEEENVEAARLLLAAGADVNRGHWGPKFAPLQVALMSMNEELVRMLIDAGAKVDAAFERRQPVLSRVIKKGWADLAVQLIRSGADVNARDDNDETPLAIAAYRMAVKRVNFEPVPRPMTDAEVGLVRALIDAGADVNAATGPEKETALIFAARGGHTEMVRMLLEKGADPTAVTTRNDTAIMSAHDGNHTATVDVLLEYVHVKGGGQSMLASAAINGQVGLVKKIIATGADLNVAGREGARPLHEVALKGTVEVAKVLLDAGADANCLGFNQCTPLECASQNGHMAMVELLIGAGADVSIGSATGETALMTAAYFGHVEIVRRLLEAGANPSQTNHDRQHALDYAKAKGHSAVVEVLEPITREEMGCCAIA